jgi:hypothetical protein
LHLERVQQQWEDTEHRWSRYRVQQYRRFLVVCVRKLNKKVAQHTKPRLVSAPVCATSSTPPATSPASSSQVETGCVDPALLVIWCIVFTITPLVKAALPLGDDMAGCSTVVDQLWKDIDMLRPGSRTLLGGSRADIYDWLWVGWKGGRGLRRVHGLSMTRRDDRSSSRRGARYTMRPICRCAWVVGKSLGDRRWGDEVTQRWCWRDKVG